MYKSGGSGILPSCYNWSYHPTPKQLCLIENLSIIIRKTPGPMAYRYWNSDSKYLQYYGLTGFINYR